MRLLSALVLPRRRSHDGGADRLTGPVGNAAASAACPAFRDAPPPPPPRKNRAGDCGPGPAARSRHGGVRVRPVGGRPRGKARRRGPGAPAPVRTRGAVAAAVLTAAFALLPTALRAAGQEEVRPTVSINSPSVAEGAAGTTATLTFTVSLDAAGAEAVTVDYAEGTGGTAASGTDYTAPASGTLTFAADETSKTIAVSVTGDATDEPDETVVLTLGNASGATVGTGTGTGTITDDDAAPTVTLALADDSISENGGTTTVSATLSHPSSAATTITITPVADAYTVGSDATITIAAGDTANASDTAAISAVDNDTGEADRSVTVTGSADNAQGIGQVTGASLTLEDDDGGPTPAGPTNSEPTVSINSPSVAEGAAGTTATLTFTVSLDAASAEAVTVDYAEGTGGTAASGTDYTAPASGTLTFAADETSKTIAVSVTGDATDEPDETVVVTLGNASGATVGSGTGTGTITDDDAAPTVTLALADDSISENGGTTTVSATLSHASSADTTITISPLANAYTVDADATITIAAGDTANASDTATINAVDNENGEADRSVTVTGSADNAQGIGQVTGASLTLEDDDGGAGPTGPSDSEPTVSINSPSVAEGAAGTTATLTFTVSLDAASDGEVTVDYAEGTGGTAESGTDYTAPASGTLTFAVGDTSKSITVSVTGDTTDEPDETVVVTLGNASGATIGTGTGTGTITDDDAAPTVTLALADDSIPENGGTTTVSATLSHPSSAATTITITPVADAYTVGSDATITIAAGDTANASDTAAITAVDNATDEANRSVTVTGSASNAQGAGSVTGAGLTLIDDDGQPSLTINAPSVAEGDSGSASLTWTVTLSPPGTEAVTVDYAEGMGGTAASGTDYTALASGTLTFAAGDTSKTITVSVTGDTTDEPDETVVVTLGNASGATIGTGTGTGTITDDDAAPTVTLSLADDSISENGGATTVSATLSHPSSAATTITITAVADAYTVGSDATITIAAGDTANASDTAAITAVDNDTGEADRSVTVTGSAGNAQGIGQVTGASLTLEDDDGGAGPTEPSDDEPTVSINSPSVSEGAAGTTATLTFTVSLDAAGDGEVTVDYAEGTGGTAESGTDYTAPASGTLTFAVGDTSGTITVSVTGDATDEPDETVVVTLGNASGATVGTASGTGTITDDDAAPTVTLSLADDSIPENGGTTTVSATLSHPSSEATTITISAVADAYTVGSDATITIAAGSTANPADTAVITAVDNATDEGNRSVTVTGSASNAQGAGPVTGAGLTLIDDDGQPSLTINAPSVAEGDSGSASLTWTVTLSPAGTEAVTVDYAEGTGGTAESGTDYTAPASGTLTFAVGDTSRSITVSVTGDTTDEPDETVVVTLGNASGATIGTASGTGTIRDDDAAPTVTLALADDSIPENGGSTTVSATLSHPSSEATTITITPVADAYTVGADATITIAAGDTANASDTAAISAVDNNTGEADRSVTVTGSAGNAQGIGQVTGASLTLEDDDGGSGPTGPSDDEPTMSIDSPSVAEGAAGTTATLTFTVSLGAASAEAVTVAYAVATGGTATAGTDYAAPASGTLTIAAGDTGATIAVTVIGDGVDEPDETILMTLGEPAGATLGTGTGTGTGTITDDDAAPTVTLSLADDSIPENGGTTTVSATLGNASSEATTITIAALADAYTVGADDTITIPAGDTANASDTVTITAVDNATDEANRSVTVTGSATNAQGAGPVTGAGLTLLDDDGEPSLTINAPGVTEGDGGSASLNFTVTLSPASGGEVTVGYAEGTGGTAASGTDYTALASGTLTFAAGDTSKTITVSVTGDTTDEPDETVVVTLGNAAGATVGTASGTGTIRDDDAAPTVTLSLADDSIPENGGATTVSATLSHPSSAATTITITAVANAYTVGSDATITIPAGDTANASDTATINAVDNDTGEADRSVTVTGSAGNTQGIGRITGASLTLEDDDGQSSLTINAPSVTEGDSGSASLIYTVTLSPASTGEGNGGLRGGDGRDGGFGDGLHGARFGNADLRGGGHQQDDHGVGNGRHDGRAGRNGGGDAGQRLGGGGRDGFGDGDDHGRRRGADGDARGGGRFDFGERRLDDGLGDAEPPVERRDHDHDLGAGGCLYGGRGRHDHHPRRGDGERLGHGEDQRGGQRHRAGGPPRDRHRFGEQRAGDRRGNRRGPDDRGRRRRRVRLRAIAGRPAHPLHLLAERNGGRQRFGFAALHGNAECGERRRSNGALREDGRHGDRGDGLQGARFRDADLRGGRNEQDDHGIGNRRHHGRAERDGGGDAQRPLGRDGGDRNGDGDDHGRRRGADGDAFAGGRFDPGDREHVGIGDAEPRFERGDRDHDSVGDGGLRGGGGQQDHHRRRANGERNGHGANRGDVRPGGHGEPERHDYRLRNQHAGRGFGNGSNPDGDRHRRDAVADDQLAERNGG